MCIRDSLYAGLVARINQEKGKSSGFINPVIYANPSLARDITVGNNNTTANNTGYPAGPGWDACELQGAERVEDLIAACTHIERAVGL